MMTDNNTNWRNVWAIHAIMPSPPGLSAGGSPIKAMIANTYAHHIEPTTLVRNTAIWALTPLALATSARSPRILIASAMWWRALTGLEIEYSDICSPHWLGVEL